MRLIEGRIQRLVDLKAKADTESKLKRLENDFRTLCDRQESSLSDLRALLLQSGANIETILDRSASPLLISAAEFSGSLESELTSQNITTMRKNIDDSVKNEYRDGSDETHEGEDVLLGAEANPQPMYDGKRHFDRVDIEKVLGKLGTRYGLQDQSWQDITAKASRSPLDRQVCDHLSDWSKQTSSDSLWIQGPHGTATPSPNTITSIFLMTLARRNRLPFIFFICDARPHTASADHDCNAPNMLVDVLTSLIAQMVSLMPAIFSTSSSLSPERFEKLRQSSADFDMLLQLFVDCRAVLPFYLQCIIGGIENLEDRDDVRHTERLCRFFQTLLTIDQDCCSVAKDSVQTRHIEDVTRETEPEGTQQPTSYITKVCFFTDGYVDVLGRLVDQNLINAIEYIDDEDEGDEGQDFIIRRDSD